MDKLDKTYEYIRHLGGGEFSNVFLVRHVETGVDRVVKILDYHYLLQRLKKQNLTDTKHKFDEIKRRFIVEARLYEKIDHPNIVQIRDTDVFQDPEEGIEIPYFIMNYIKGSSLAEVIKEEAPLETRRVIEISRDVLHALSAMHRNNIIHRDIKASNIMIEEETGKAVIIDFGIAKDIMGGTKLTTTGALLGSPAYMAPEQFIDSSNVTPSLDIYSFGVVLFEMLTGAPPFKGGNFIEVMNAHRQRPIPTPSSIIPGLPQGADSILAKAMAKRPENRYGSAQELLDALEMIHIPQTEPDFHVPPKPYWQYVVGFAILIIAILFILNPFSVDTDPEKTTPTEIKKTEKAQKKPPVHTPSQTENKEDASLTSKDNGEEKQSTENGKDEPVQTGQTGKTDPKTTESPPVKDTTEQDFNRALAGIKSAIDSDRFQLAENQLKKAETLKGTDNEHITALRAQLAAKRENFDKKNGTDAFEGFTDPVTLKQYREFSAAFPESIHLSQLKKRLKASQPNLPPEKYWLKEIGKNSKGYYEYIFPVALNRHHMVYIPSRNFWIDKYEVSNVQYRRYLKALNLPHTGADAGSGSKFIHGGDLYPAVVKLREAEAYCKYFGFRLPTIAEWEYAAGSATYPWGNQAPDSEGIWRANYDTLGDTSEMDGFNGTAPVNSFKPYSSPFSVVNMAGNVWEWVQGGLLKGGSFFSSAEDLVIKKSRGGRGNDKEGFRCVYVDEPGS